MPFQNEFGERLLESFESGCFEVYETLQVMSPTTRRAKNRRTEPAEVVEVPSSPSDPDMSLDARSDPFALERRQQAISASDARGDPQRLIQNQRTLEMVAEIVRLRNALCTEEISGQHRIQ